MHQAAEAAIVGEPPHNSIDRRGVEVFHSPADGEGEHFFGKAAVEIGPALPRDAGGEFRHVGECLTRDEPPGGLDRLPAVAVAIPPQRVVGLERQAQWVHPRVA